MSPIVIAALIAAVPTSWTAWLAWTTRRQKDKTAVVRVDAEAYERAQKINQQIVQALREELERVRGELNEMRRVVETSEQQEGQLKDHIARLHRSLTRALALLSQYNIDIPADLEVDLNGAPS